MPMYMNKSLSLSKAYFSISTWNSSASHEENLKGHEEIPQKDKTNFVVKEGMICNANSKNDKAIHFFVMNQYMKL
jgi:hypothetical protein